MSLVKYVQSREGQEGGYNISEQQLFEALKMNYTGDSFICLQIHFISNHCATLKRGLVVEKILVSN